MNLKTILKNIFNFYLRASIHVALAIATIAYICLSELNIVPTKNFYPFVFMAVLVGYNILKYYHLLKKDLSFLNKNPLIWLITLIAFIIGLIFFWEFSTFLQISILIFAFMTLGYLYFRKYALLKIFYVSFVVVTFTSFVTIISQNAFIVDYIPISLGWFFIIVSWMIPFEILDSIKDDLPHKTIPQKIGLSNAKKVGYVFLTLFVIIQYFFLTIDLTKIFIIIISILAINFATPNRSFYYSAFWVEAIPIVWFFLSFIK